MNSVSSWFGNVGSQLSKLSADVMGTSAQEEEEKAEGGSVEETAKQQSAPPVAPKTEAEGQEGQMKTSLSFDAERLKNLGGWFLFDILRCKIGSPLFCFPVFF